jgi:hypothetical protein
MHLTSLRLVQRLQPIRRRIPIVMDREYDKEKVKEKFQDKMD